MSDNIKKSGYLCQEEIVKQECIPSKQRRKKGPVAVIECVEDIPCNPCEKACPRSAIHVGDDITSLPVFDEEKCNGCGLCIPACPGLAIFVVDESLDGPMARIKMPFEFQRLPKAGESVLALNRAGKAICDGKAEKVVDVDGNNKTPVVYLLVPKEAAMEVRGIRLKDTSEDDDMLICRCMEVTKGEIKEAAKKAGVASLAAIKRRTTAGMGICQGRTCSKLITDILAQELSVGPDEIAQDTARPPVRALTLDALEGGSK